MSIEDLKTALHQRIDQMSDVAELEQANALLQDVSSTIIPLSEEEETKVKIAEQQIAAGHFYTHAEATEMLGKRFGQGFSNE